jgi:hypothetical protein
MPQDKGFTNIVANTTVNVLNGRLFERLGGRPAMIKAYASALSGASGACDSTFIAGSDVLGLECGLRILAAGPVVPDDQVVSGSALAGDPLQWNIRNTTGADIIVGWLLDITNV